MFICNVQYILYTALNKVHLNSVQFTSYSVQRTVYSIHCTMYSVKCTLYIVQCKVYSVQCTVYTVHWTVSPPESLHLPSGQYKIQFPIRKLLDWGRHYYHHQQKKFSIDPALRLGRFIVLKCMSVCLSAILSRPIYFFHVSSNKFTSLPTSCYPTYRRKNIF